MSVRLPFPRFRFRPMIRPALAAPLLRWRPLQRPLLLGTGLGFFALELLRARMVLPARTWRCFRLLGLFLQAGRQARSQLAPLLSGDPLRQAERLRYARNCIVLVALQPDMAPGQIRPTSAWLQPAALYGACIPLYDGCFDQRPTRQARHLAADTAAALTDATRSGTLAALVPLLRRHGARAEDAAAWEALIRALDHWLQRQSPERQRLLLLWMARMNDAQLASLAERNITLPLHERRRISALKGGVSFLLLRCLCLPEGSDPTGASDPIRAALLQAAAVAQWIDDYADLDDDRHLGIHTYIGRLEASGRADATIRAGLRQAAADLRQHYGSKAERFINSLGLYYALKRSLRFRARLQRALER